MYIPLSVVWRCRRWGAQEAGIAGGKPSGAIGVHLHDTRNAAPYCSAVSELSNGGWTAREGQGAAGVVPLRGAGAAVMQCQPASQLGSDADTEASQRIQRHPLPDFRVA